MISIYNLYLIYLFVKFEAIRRPKHQVPCVSLLSNPINCFFLSAPVPPSLSHCIFKSSFCSSLQAHEFVDEQMYEQNCLETALQTYPSRSPSISSHDSTVGTCCGRKAKRNTPLPNASLPSTHQGPLQELSAIHIQCGDPPSHTAR